MDDVDAFVIHWEAPEWCAESVASLRASEDVSVRVAVINNGGALRLPDDVAVVQVGRNAGYAAAANIALDRWRPGQHVFIGCHDIRLNRRGMRALLDALERDPGLGVVGPVIDGGTSGRDEADLHWISGAGMLIRGEVAGRVRFDERYGSYSEDLDFCFRIRDQGWRVGRADSARASTRGSVDERRAFVLMHSNTLAFFVQRRMWRLAAARVLMLVWGSMRISSGQAALCGEALVRGLLQTARLGVIRTYEPARPRPSRTR